MRYISLLLLLFSSLLFSKEPVWVLNPYDVYNKKIYEVGVGNGRTEKEAENSAYSALANIFGMKISTDTRAIEKYIETSSGIEETRILDNNTRIEAEHNLINVKIDEKYYDEKRDIYYAVAVLNKKETSVLLEKKIKENVDVIRTCINKAAKEEDLLNKYSSLYMAYIFSEKNSNFLLQLSIIDPLKDINMSDRFKMDNIKLQLEDIKRKITFSIETIDITPNIESAIEHSINELGFKISSNPSYIIRDKFTFDGNDTGYGMYILNYTLILEIIDYNGDRIASFKFRGKDGGSSEKDAKRIVMNKIAREINKNLSNQISDFLDEKFKN